MKNGKCRRIADFTGDKVLAAEVPAVEFPKLLDPVDGLPPAAVITHVRPEEIRVVLRGTTADKGTVKKVLVTGPTSQGPDGRLHGVGSGSGRRPAG
jgi:hypothetical protein